MRFSYRSSALACGLILAACGGGTTEPAPDPSIGVTLSGPVNLVQGQSNSAIATVSRVAFAGTVRLSLTGLPPGVTGKFEPTTLPEGTATSTLTLDAALTANVGTATMTVTATATGVASAATSVPVSVSEAPGFSMVVAPTALNIERGRDGVATVTLERRGGFSGPVALSISGLPAGVIASFADPAPTGGSTVLTLGVDKSVELGSYPLAISGQGTPGTQVANLTLNVTANQPAPGYSLAVDPASIALAAGSSGQAAVTIARDNGFTSPVNLSLEGQPAGVTASFDNAAPTGGSAALTLTTLSSTVPGVYPLLLRGTVTGLADRTTSLTLTVSAASGGFTLSLAPSSMELQVGLSGTVAVTVLKIGSFTGAVTLSAANLPAGVTVGFSPPSASASGGPTGSSTTSSVMTVTVGPAVVSGNYLFQVVGQADGQTDQTAPFLLVVNPPPGSGNTSFSFCGSGLPIWFAYRDGGGPWTRVIGVPAGAGISYSFNVTGGLGGAAFVRGSDLTGYTVTVLQGTQAELQQFGAAQCTISPSGNKTLSGSIAGVGPDDQVSVALSRASESPSAAAPTFTLKRVQSGPADLIAVQSATSAGGPPFRARPLKVIVRPGTDYPDGSAIPVLDFSIQGFAPVSAGLTIGNLGADLATVLLTYETPTTTATLQYGVDEASTSQVLYGLPAADQPAGGLHTLTLLAAPPGVGDGRSWVGWFRTLADRTASLGDVLAPPAVTRLGGTYPRFEAAGSVQPDYDDLMSFEVRQDLSDGSWRWWVLRSSAATFNGGSYAIGMPDFTAVAGWTGEWTLRSGAVAQWVVTGAGISGNAVIPPETDGSTLRTATRSGLVAP